jgi:hypothetical protein
MKLRNTCMAWVALILLAAGTPLTANDGAMDALSSLVGEWEGEGWMRQGPGEPHRFRSHERVERKLGGRILTIHGRHYDSHSGDLVFEAFAVVSPSNDGYRFSSYLADGRSGEYRGWLEDGDFHWEIPVPDIGRMVYRLQVDDGVWTEAGHIVGDGEPGPAFFGMRLTRVLP